MPLITALLGGILTICGSVVGRVLIALGMAYVTYSGFDLVVTWLFDRIKTDMSSMPAEAVNFLAFLWVDKAIGMIFSAYTVAQTVKLAGGSKLTKLITKG